MNYLAVIEAVQQIIQLFLAASTMLLSAYFGMLQIGEITMSQHVVKAVDVRVA